MSEKESVVNAESGDPVKKLVVVRSDAFPISAYSRFVSDMKSYALSRYCKRSATASRSVSSKSGS